MYGGKLNTRLQETTRIKVTIPEMERRDGSQGVSSGIDMIQASNLSCLFRRQGEIQNEGSTGRFLKVLPI